MIQFTQAKTICIQTQLFFTVNTIYCTLPIISVSCFILLSFMVIDFFNKMFLTIWF